MSSSRLVGKLPRALAGLALLGGSAALLTAQEQQAQRAAPQPGGIIDPNSLAGKESTEGVYVRDSAIALEKFALAQKMERLKEWNKSADLYQEVIDKYPDRVVPSRTNEDDKIVQYTSVTRGVMERLARWPKEGLDVYRARYEPSAAAMLENAGGLTRGDVAEMHKVFYRYFVTDTAKSVGLRLVDVNLERGEFQAAARLADELLTLHPNLGDARPTLLYRAALAHRLAGDDAKAKERLATLQKNHADAKGLVRGKEVTLAESLAHELQTITSARATTATAAADSWTTLGGDASRGLVTSAGGRPGARLFAVPLSRPQWREMQAGVSRGNFETTLANQAASGALNGVFPVVDRGELFFQDGRRVYARSLESGDPLPGWLQTYPAPEDRAGLYVLPGATGSPRTHQLTLTLTDRAVLGVMGQTDRNMLQQMVQGTEPRLVCLDRRTGKENWVATMGNIELPKDLPDDQQKAIRDLKMNGAPLVVGDSVMVMARGVKQAQFEDSWVLCFHLATGKYRWSCYLASASNVGAAWGGQPTSIETTSHLAYANGRIYALSNLGALAAVDAYSGTIAWLSIYERGVSQFDAFINGGGGGGNVPGGMGQPPKPWTYNPVIVKDGKVFVLPTEGRYIYVYDANSGAEVKRINRTSWGKIGNVEMLLAVMGDRMVVASDRVIGFFDWRKYDPENPDACLHGLSSEFDGLRGRPFVTADSIFATDSKKLHRLTFAKQGKVEEDYPAQADKTWDEREEGPGNVLVTSDHVVIAGATHVYGFTDLNLAKTRLDREVAAAPQEAGPRLRYARVLFTAGDTGGTIAKLDEAIALLGGRGSMRPGADRDWVFNDAISFAQKLAGDRGDDATPPDNAPGEAEPPSKPPPQFVKQIDELYDRAASAASSAQQQVQYRLTRARFAASKEDLAGAAKLYQQVLGEPELRPVPLVDEKTGGPTQAAAVAEGQIKALVVRGGVKLYAAFEAEAAKRLADAQAAKPVKPEALVEVADAYPNAITAPKALLAAAEAYESLKQPQPAVQALRQAYFKYGQAVDKPRVIEAMARDYLALPNRVDVAAARIAQGVSLPGEHKLIAPLRLPDGTEIAKDTPFPKALDDLRKYSTRIASKDLADFKLPPVPTTEQYQALKDVLEHNPRWPFPQSGAEPVIDGVNALAVPMREFARPNRVVFWSAGGTKLQIRKPGDSNPLGVSTTAMTDAPKGSAWVSGGGDDVLVWSNSAIALVPQTGGDATWRVEVKNLPTIVVVKPPAPSLGGDGDMNAAADQLRMRRRQEQLAIVMARQNGQFVLRNGAFQPPFRPPVVLPPRPDAGAAEAINDVRPVGDRVLLTTSTGRVFCVELSGKNAGHVAWQTRLSDRPADRLVANDDFTVVKVSDDASVRLVCLDTVSGQIRGTKSFTTNNNDFPVNLALSADGTLVYTLPTRLVLKDLYKPWDAADSERNAAAGGVVPSDSTNPMPFRNASGPDQLIISEGRILALADMGSGQLNDHNGFGGTKYVRLHSLETGQAITLKVSDKKGDLTDMIIYAETGPPRSWDIHLHAVGSRLYIRNSIGVLCYDLDRPKEFWQQPSQDAIDQVSGTVRDMFIGKDHAVTLSQLGPGENGDGDVAPPAAAPAQPRKPRPSKWQLTAYARYPGQAGGTAESGRTDYVPVITESAAITQWQGVTGGFYYLTQDGKLHYLTAVN
jgi:outer membrane protein assembly factor BamB